MSDTRGLDEAWRLAPHRYLAGRAATCRVPSAPFSLYLPMRDGVRLAIDVHLPEPLSGAARPERLSTIIVFTPYYRRFKLSAEAPPTSEPSPNTAKYRDAFVPRGYALAVVDVRGTGASFGVREGFRSPEEREDYRAVVDWIVNQPWSDGRVGVTGVSYLGAACDFTASTGHPAVKAIAPLFSVWDTYSDHYYPGGLLLNRLAETYDELMVALDHDRRDLLPKFAYFKDPHLRGPMPVDDDLDGTLARQAVAQHLNNFHMPDFIREFPFKDDCLPYDSSFTSGSFSPYHYAHGIRDDIAVYSVSGWMDGAGYTNGSVSRFLSLPNPNRHLLLGPWDHGARINVSPFRDEPAAQFPILGEVLRFFDHYLLGLDTGLDRESPVHYFTMREETWREAATWPPIETRRRLSLGAGQRLVDGGGEPGTDEHKTDFSFGTGANTRYGRLGGLDIRDYYADWHGRDARLLCFTSAPLSADHELSGHPIVTLHLALDQHDAGLHVFLEDIDPAGRAWYVTEGLLRALHRKEAPAPRLHRVVGPYRTFARKDAAAMVPGEPAVLRFAMLPVSWLFKAGHCLRLAISGADCDNYGQMPHGRPPRMTVLRGGATNSEIELPLARRES